jgi:hypothetical protein
VLLLALNPDGLRGRELGRELHGPDCNLTTVRAEISRLRRLLGPVLTSEPYRLDAEVSSDFGEVERLIARGDRVAARERYRGSLLATSEVPAIIAVRDRIAEGIQDPFPTS